MVDRPGHGVADQLLALRVGEDRNAAEPLRQLLDADDVVVVVVGEEDVGDRRPLALDPLAERIGRQVGVDQDPRAADLVDREVGVRQPFGLLDALKDHAEPPGCSLRVRFRRIVGCCLTGNHELLIRDSMSPAGRF